MDSLVRKYREGAHHLVLPDLLEGGETIVQFEYSPSRSITDTCIGVPLYDYGKSPYTTLLIMGSSKTPLRHLTLLVIKSNLQYSGELSASEVFWRCLQKLYLCVLYMYRNLCKCTHSMFLYALCSHSPPPSGGHLYECCIGVRSDLTLGGGGWGADIQSS